MQETELTEDEIRQTLLSMMPVGTYNDALDAGSQEIVDFQANRLIEAGYVLVWRP